MSRVGGVVIEIRHGRDIQVYATLLLGRDMLLAWLKELAL